MAHMEVLAKEIEELEKVAFGNPQSAEDSSTETVQESEEETVIETEEEISDTFDLTPFEESTESTDNVIAQEDNQPVQKVTEEPTKPTRTNWKKKYNELDKRFRNLKASNDSTIFTLRTGLAKAQKKEKELYERVDDLSRKLSEAQANSKDDFELDLLSEDERDIVGPETLAAVKKLSKASIDAQVKPLKEQLEEEKRKRLEDLEQMSKANENQARLNFLKRLGDIVPDYAELDVNSEFLSWMSLPDDLSGSTRKDLFKLAYSNGDVGRVAQFFLDFKTLRKADEEILEQDITPKATSSNSINNTTKLTKPKKIHYVSLAKINQFYNDVSKGYYKGREDLQRQIEQEINKAQAENRIAP